jgi:hypothetical protein
MLDRMEEQRPIDPILDLGLIQMCAAPGWRFFSVDGSGGGAA